MLEARRLQLEQSRLVLAAVKEEIELLEDQINMLRLDDSSDQRPSGNRFWSIVGHHDEQDLACTCLSCNMDEMKIEAAVTEAGVYKQRLNRVLGRGDRGKSTLELERERIREA